MVKRIVMRATGGILSEIIERKSQEFNSLRKKERTALYASDCFQCMRKVWYQFYADVFEPGEIDGRTARIFANGEDVHFRLSAYLADEKDLEFDREIGVPRDELEVHGRCDGVAMHQGRFMVVEFKSINKQFVPDAKDEHLGQLQWYLGMFELRRKQLREEFDVKDNDIVVDVDALYSQLTNRNGTMLSMVEKQLLRSNGPPTGELIYEAKPTQNINSFIVEYDVQKFSAVRSWFVELRNAVESGIRPTVHYKETRFPCSWTTGKCQYFDACYGPDAVQDDILVQLGISARKLQAPVVEMVVDKVHGTVVPTEEAIDLLQEAESVEKEEDL